MTTRDTAAEIKRRIEAVKSDMAELQRRMRQQDTQYHEWANLLDINKAVLNWLNNRKEMMT